MSKPKDAVSSTRSHSQRKWKLKMESVDLNFFSRRRMTSATLAISLTLHNYIIIDNFSNDCVRRMSNVIKYNWKLKTENGSLPQNVFIQLCYIDINRQQLEAS